MLVPRKPTDAEIEAGLRSLDQEPQRVPAHAWPATLLDLDSPGLYSWWVDAEGADALSRGLRAAVRA